MLVDDPHDTATLQRYQALLQAGAVAAVVVGFDPLQLADSIADHAYRHLVQQLHAVEHQLISCYRQKAAVGAIAAQVATAVAASSPFLLESKKLNYAAERRQVTAVANTLRFPNPSGRVVTEEAADLAAWTRHLAWIRAQQLWQHWPPLLIVTERGLNLPQAWLAALKQIRFEQIELTNSTAIKGLEYQHVALVMGPERWKAIRDGFTGSGRSMYDEYRLARIPFSRAKDSIGIFVLQQPAVRVA